MGDTDLWFHLSGGRYFSDTGLLPATSYFSFIEPAKSLIDYYWLFQVFVFKLFSLAGYQGLVIFRAIVYLATIGLVFAYLASGEKKATLQPATLALFVLYGLSLILRLQLVRPHLFSYLFIVLSLYLLEHKRGFVFLLPIITLAWANLHGIEYPVALVIYGAYLGEFIFEHFKNGKPATRTDKVFVLSLAVAMGTICLTPHGLSMLALPFSLPAHVSLYIDELQPVPLAQLTSFRFAAFAPDVQTIVNTLLVLSCVGIARAVVAQKLRLSHTLLWACALILLLRAARFRIEFILLVLPLLSAQFRSMSFDFVGAKLRPVCLAAFGILLILVPAAFLQQTFSSRPKYPFSNRGLPAGIVAFLNEVQAGGTVLNDPGYGGYLQWRLFPRYTIFMDLQMSMFDDADFFEAATALTDSAALGNFISKYQPDFISSPLAEQRFRHAIGQFPEYVCVFYDDIQVLYANSTRKPKIAADHALRLIDPFQLGDLEVATLPRAQQAALTGELMRVHETYPEGALTNYVLGSLLLESQQFDAALRHAQKIIDAFPEAPKGYLLRADILAASKRHPDALAALTAALGRATVTARADIFKRLWFCHAQMENYVAAYKALKKGVNPFSMRHGYEDIFNLASAALMVGKAEEGQMLLKLAAQQVPAANMEWSQRIAGISRLVATSEESID